MLLSCRLVCPLPCERVAEGVGFVMTRVLSDVAITDSASAVAAMDALHAKGVRCVVITSSNLPAGQSEVCVVLPCRQPLFPRMNSFVAGFVGVDSTGDDLVCQRSLGYVATVGV